MFSKILHAEGTGRAVEKREYTKRYIEKMPASSPEQYQLHVGPSQQNFISPAFLGAQMILWLHCTSQSEQTLRSGGLHRDVDTALWMNQITLYRLTQITVTVIQHSDVESGATACAEENIPSVGVNNQLKNLLVFFSLVD